MSNENSPKINQIVLRPSIKHWLSNEWLTIVFNVLGYFLLFTQSCPKWLLLLPAFITLHLLHQAITLLRKRFSFEDDMLIYEQGIFSRERKYLNIVLPNDCNEAISIVQDLFRVKTEVIYCEREKV